MNFPTSFEHHDQSGLYRWPEKLGSNRQANQPLNFTYNCPVELWLTGEGTAFLFISTGLYKSANHTLLGFSLWLAID